MMNSFTEIRDHIILLEQAEKMVLPKLPYEQSALEPVMSEETIEYHYGTLTKNYYKNASRTGDSFQVAGAYLHGLFWENLREPSEKNAPNGAVRFLILNTWGTLGRFKTDFTDGATSGRGNGWMGLTRTGKLVWIANHKKRKDLVLVLDMWEHSYYLDYKTDKKAYVKNFWKIVNWDIVNERLSNEK